MYPLVPRGDSKFILLPFGRCAAAMGNELVCQALLLAGRCLHPQHAQGQAALGTELSTGSDTEQGWALPRTGGPCISRSKHVGRITGESSGLHSVCGTPKQALPPPLTAAAYVIPVKSLASQLKKQK